MSDKGKNTFQPSLINWSYLYLGKVALIHKKQNNKKQIFIMNHKIPGIIFSASIPNGGKYPPMKNITVIALTRIIFAYSPKKNKAKLMEEYSTLYPATSSASASGKSNGWRLVSARPEIKNTIIMGKSKICTDSGISRCFSTISTKFSEPVYNNTVIITSPIETSYDIICEADLIAPKNAYFELLAQPAIIMP